mmetsp:Transcript_132064/g.313004  ORF Transcript_132064/g.313004 Transcript_132064/m.313004 type:complete len:224 (-) Transcript_132064:2348-3019(-)
MDPGKGDELKLSPSRRLQIHLNEAFEQQKVCETKSEGASADRLSIKQANDVHGGGIETPKKDYAIHQPPPQHSVSQETGFQLIVHSITHLQADSLLVAICADHHVVAHHIGDQAVHVGPCSGHAIPQGHGGVPVSHAKSPNQVVEGDSKESHHEREDGVHVDQRNQGLVDNGNCPGGLHVQVQVYDHQVCGHPIHDPAHRVLVEEAVDGCFEDALEHVPVDLR